MTAHKTDVDSFGAGPQTEFSNQVGVDAWSLKASARHGDHVRNRFGRVVSVLQGGRGRSERQTGRMLLVQFHPLAGRRAKRRRLAIRGGFGRLFSPLQGCGVRHARMAISHA